VPDLVFTDHRIRTPAADSGAALNSVESAVASNEWNRARELLERVPGRNAYWHILSSKVYDGLNDPSRAVQEAEAALSIEPRNEAAHLQLGQIFLGRNTPDAAAEIFSEALVLFPESQMLRLGRGLAYKELGRGEDGEKDLRQCLARDPSLAIAFDALATILIHARRYDEARELAGTFRKTSPRDYRGPYFAAAALEGEKQTGADIEALLRDSLVLNPNFAAAWALLGKVILRSERVADAVAPLERAVALRPDLVPARMQLAEAYRKLGRESDAAREFQAVRELNDKERQPPPRLQYRRGRL
jgi:predicted Zn-dependent protease